MPNKQPLDDQAPKPAVQSAGEAALVRLPPPVLDHGRITSAFCTSESQAAVDAWIAQDGIPVSGIPSDRILQ